MMRNRQHHEPTLATILEEVRQLREDLKSRNRALLPVPEAAAFLGLPEKSIRNRLGPKATDPFPITPVRLGGRVLFRRCDLEQFVAALAQK
jgi:predicted DNA-binding transcriptional regulator AlpA